MQNILKINNFSLFILIFIILLSGLQCGYAIQPVCFIKCFSQQNFSVQQDLIFRPSIELASKEFTYSCMYLGKSTTECGDDEISNYLVNLSVARCDKQKMMLHNIACSLAEDTGQVASRYSDIYKVQMLELSKSCQVKNLVCPPGTSRFSNNSDTCYSACADGYTMNQQGFCVLDECPTGFIPAIDMISEQKLEICLREQPCDSRFFDVSDNSTNKTLPYCKKKTQAIVPKDDFHECGTRGDSDNNPLNRLRYTDPETREQKEICMNPCPEGFARKENDTLCTLATCPKGWVSVNGENACYSRDYFYNNCTEKDSVSSRCIRKILVPSGTIKASECRKNLDDIKSNDVLYIENTKGAGELSSTYSAYRVYDYFLDRGTHQNKFKIIKCYIEKPLGKIMGKLIILKKQDNNAFLSFDDSGQLVFVTDERTALPMCLMQDGLIFWFNKNSQQLESSGLKAVNLR